MTQKKLFRHEELRSTGRDLEKNPYTPQEAWDMLGMGVKQPKISKGWRKKQK